MLLRRSADNALKNNPRNSLVSARLPELLPFLVVSAPLDPLEPAVGVEAARAGAADWAPGRGWPGPGVVVAVVIGAGAPAVLTGSVVFVCNTYQVTLSTGREKCLGSL